MSAEVTYAPITLREWDVLVDSGVLEGQRVELIEGEKIVMSPEKLPHVQGMQEVADRLVDQVGMGRVRVQHPLRCTHDPDAPGTDPEPDLVVTRQHHRDYLGRGVRAEDAELVVEISHASRRFDRGRKMRVYARAGVVEYWVVDLAAEQVVVHTEPQEDFYRQVATFGLDEPVVSTGGLTVTVGRDVLRSDEE